MVIALEGLPGAGKTTTAQLLSRRLHGASVHETTHAHPFLETVYDDATRFDLPVELAFLLLHSAGYRPIPRDSVVVTDFSPVKDLVFAQAMLSSADLVLFEELYKRLYADAPPPEVVVYLDAPLHLCLRRIERRMKLDASRAFEAGMDIDHLRRISEVYESHMLDLGDVVRRIQVDPADTEDEVVDSLVRLLGDELPQVTSSTK